MEKPPKTVANGVSPGNKQLVENGRKNRLRILGTAILERENEPNITASYNYTAGSPNEFFEEDIDQLHYFELNKIALGLTVHKKESPHKNGVTNGSVYENGLKNGSPSNGSTALKRFTGGSGSDPFHTDVIWSRMDMQYPSADNPNAYIIKQYYNNNGIPPGGQEQPRLLVQSHGERWNTFICGFISCLAMVLLVGCTLSYLPNKNF